MTRAAGRRLPGTGQAGQATLLATLADASVAQGFLAVTVRPWQVMLTAGVANTCRERRNPRNGEAPRRRSV